jgi:hypothetical protein
MGSIFSCCYGLCCCGDDDGHLTPNINYRTFLFDDDSVTTTNSSSDDDDDLDKNVRFFGYQQQFLA